MSSIDNKVHFGYDELDRSDWMIKAIFFDIDGTLVPYGMDHMPASTLRALHALREKGVLLFIATGRTPHTIDHVQRMFDFDGYVTSNGQYCFNRDKVIHEKYIPRDSFEKLIPYLKQQDITIVMATLSHSYLNKESQLPYDEHYPVIDPQKLCEEPLIQIMAYIDEAEDEAFLEHLPHCKSARWTPVFADIIPEDGGKDKGIDYVIEEYGIHLDEVMVFGDGGNDISMLSHVKHSVAMGNANDKVKASASYTTSDILDDGIYRALVHFGVLEE